MNTMQEQLEDILINKGIDIDKAHSVSIYLTDAIQAISLIDNRFIGVSESDMDILIETLVQFESILISGKKVTDAKEALQDYLLIRGEDNLKMDTCSVKSATAAQIEFTSRGWVEGDVISVKEYQANIVQESPKVFGKIDLDAKTGPAEYDDLKQTVIEQAIQTHNKLNNKLKLNTMNIQEVYEHVDTWMGVNNDNNVQILATCLDLLNKAGITIEQSLLSDDEIARVRLAFSELMGMNGDIYSKEIIVSGMLSAESYESIMNNIFFNGKDSVIEHGSVVLHYHLEWRRNQMQP